MSTGSMAAGPTAMQTGWTAAGQTVTAAGRTAAGLTVMDTGWTAVGLTATASRQMLAGRTVNKFSFLTASHKQKHCGCKAKIIISFEPLAFKKRVSKMPGHNRMSIECLLLHWKRKARFIFFDSAF